MMTRDEAFQPYEEALATINEEAQAARDNVRDILREQLKAFREASHEELKAIRVLEQKTKYKRAL